MRFVTDDQIKFNLLDVLNVSDKHFITDHHDWIDGTVHEFLI